MDWQFVRGGDDISALDVSEDLRPTDILMVHNESGFLTPFLKRIPIILKRSLRA